jgi:hypothetical protein
MRPVMQIRTMTSTAIEYVHVDLPARRGGPRHAKIVHVVENCHPRRYDAVALPTVRHQRRVRLAAVRDAATAAYDAAIRTPLIRLDLDDAAKHGGLRDLLGRQYRFAHVRLAGRRLCAVCAFGRFAITAYASR